MNKPQRRLRFIDVFCLGLNAIIGSGIFVFPGTLYVLMGPASILAFLVCSVLLASVALCYAELSGMFQDNGGSYVYAREAFGPEVGFGVGFIAWATSVLSTAAVASALAPQLGYFHPAFSSPLAVKAVAVGAVAGFGVLNLLGVRLGAWAVNAMTAAKLAPLALFVAAGLPAVSMGRYHPFFSGSGRFGAAIFLSLWALQGFEVAPVPSGETARAERDVPLAVLGSLLVSGLFYALIQWVAVGAYPGLGAGGERPLADAAASFAGPWAGAFLAAGGILSMVGFVAGSALGDPRYLSALGGQAFRRLKLDHFHPQRGTPQRAIYWTTACTIALVAVLDFARLIDLSNLAVVSQYFSTCLALGVLRVRRPEAGRPFRAPCAWITASVGCLVSGWLMTQVSLQEAAFSVGLLAFGYAARYWLA